MVKKKLKDIFAVGHDFELALFPNDPTLCSVKLDGKKLALIKRVEVAMDSADDMPVVRIEIYPRSLIVEGKTYDLTMHSKPTVTKRRG